MTPEKSRAHCSALYIVRSDDVNFNLELEAPYGAFYNVRRSKGEGEILTVLDLVFEVFRVRSDSDVGWDSGVPSVCELWEKTITVVLRARDRRR